MKCTMFESNYRSCTGRSSENICSSRVKALRKMERQDETQFITKMDGFLGFNPLECVLMSKKPKAKSLQLVMTQG